MSSAPITIDVTVKAEAVAAALGALAGAELIAACSRGLAAGLEYVAGFVAQAAGAGGAAGLNQPTGMLAQSIRGALDAPGAIAGHVGVPADSPAAGHAWLLTDADFVIMPQGHPYLAIPVGANLTGAGVAGNDSPLSAFGTSGAGHFETGRPVTVNWGGGFVFTGLTFGFGYGEAYQPYFNFSLTAQF